LRFLTVSHSSQTNGALGLWFVVRSHVSASAAMAARKSLLSNSLLQSSYWDYKV